MTPQKPTESEDGYFARQELERRKAQTDQPPKEFEEKERGRLNDLHDMKCPKCGMQLVETDLKGAKMVKCSACGGVWPNRGELDHAAKAKQPSLLELICKILP